MLVTSQRSALKYTELPERARKAIELTTTRNWRNHYYERTPEPIF
jgi:hypothetical protein